MSSDSFAFYLSQLREAFRWLDDNSVKDQKQLANGLLGPAIGYFEAMNSGTVVAQEYTGFQKEIMTKLDAILQNVKRDEQEELPPRAVHYPQEQDLKNAVIRLLSFMANGHRIECIKEIRALTGLGLKEAKDLEETVSSKFAR